MNEMFRQSLFAGVTISLIAYEIGLFLKKAGISNIKSIISIYSYCDPGIESIWNQL